jgi:hypothetical protein
MCLCPSPASPEQLSLSPICLQCRKQEDPHPSDIALGYSEVPLPCERMQEISLSATTAQFPAHDDCRTAPPGIPKLGAFRHQCPTVHPWPLLAGSLAFGQGSRRQEHASAAAQHLLLGSCLHIQATRPSSRNTSKFSGKFCRLSLIGGQKKESLRADPPIIPRLNYRAG